MSPDLCAWFVIKIHLLVRSFGISKFMGMISRSFPDSLVVFL